MGEKNKNNYILTGKKLVKFVLLTLLMLLSSVFLFACSSANAAEYAFTQPTNISQNTTISNSSTSTTSNESNTSSNSTNSSTSSETIYENETGAIGNTSGRDIRIFNFKNSPIFSDEDDTWSYTKIEITASSATQSTLKLYKHYYEDNDSYEQTVALSFSDYFDDNLYISEELLVKDCRDWAEGVCWGFKDYYISSGASYPWGLAWINDSLTGGDLAYYLGLEELPLYTPQLTEYDIYLMKYSEYSVIVQDEKRPEVFIRHTADKINELFNESGELFENAEDLIITAHNGITHQGAIEFNPYGGEISFENFKIEKDSNGAGNFTINGSNCSGKIYLGGITAPIGSLFDSTGVQVFKVNNCTFTEGWNCLNGSTVYINNSTLPGLLYNNRGLYNDTTDTSTRTVYIESGTYSETTIYSSSGGGATRYISNNYANLTISGGTFNCLIENTATLTITGGTFNGGKIYETDEILGAEYDYNCSLVNNGTATISGSSEFAYVVESVVSGANLTINGGTFKGVKSRASLTINGGAFNDGICEVYASGMTTSWDIYTNTGSLYAYGGTINGGAFNSGVYLYGNISNITITSGTFNSLVKYTGYSSTYKATISGGTFKSILDNDRSTGIMEVTAGTFTGEIENSGTMEVTGGTFDGEVTNSGTMTISSATVNNTLTNDNNGTLTVTGGEINSTVVNNGYMETTGGTINKIENKSSQKSNTISGVTMTYGVLISGNSTVGTLNLNQGNAYIVANVSTLSVTNINNSSGNNYLYLNGTNNNSGVKNININSGGLGLCASDCTINNINIENKVTILEINNGFNSNKATISNINLNYLVLVSDNAPLKIVCDANAYDINEINISSASKLPGGKNYIAYDPNSTLGDGTTLPKYKVVDNGNKECAFKDENSYIYIDWDGEPIPYSLNLWDLNGPGFEYYKAWYDSNNETDLTKIYLIQLENNANHIIDPTDVYNETTNPDGTKPAWVDNAENKKTDTGENKAPDWWYDASDNYLGIGLKVNGIVPWIGINNYDIEFDGNNQTVELKNTISGLFNNLINGANVYNVTLTGNITYSSTTANNNQDSIGALANNVTKKVNINNVSSYVNITAESIVIGGIVGKIIEQEVNTSSTKPILKDCYFRGVVTAQNTYVGGIVGRVGNDASEVYNYADIINCVSNGVINATNCNVGGICHLESYEAKVINCINFSVINLKTNSNLDKDLFVAGICSSIVSTNTQYVNTQYVKNCYNFGNIKIEHLSTYAITISATATNLDIVAETGVQFESSRNLNTLHNYTNKFNCTITYTDGENTTNYLHLNWNYQSNNHEGTTVDLTVYNKTIYTTQNMLKRNIANIISNSGQYNNLLTWHSDYNWDVSYWETLL